MTVTISNTIMLNYVENTKENSIQIYEAHTSESFFFFCFVCFFLVSMEAVVGFFIIIAEVVVVFAVTFFSFSL